MTLEILEALSRLTGWPVAQVVEHADLGDNPPPEVMAWLLEQAEQFETRAEIRGVVLYLPDIYRDCEGNFARTQSVFETAPFNIFTPSEILGLGLPSSCVHLARMVTHPELLDQARANPFFTTEAPRHALPWVIHSSLAGDMGLEVAQRWEEHIARCEGCRDNATDIDYPL